MLGHFNRSPFLCGASVQQLEINRFQGCMLQGQISKRGPGLLRIGEDVLGLGLLADEGGIVWLVFPQLVRPGFDLFIR